MPHTPRPAPALLAGLAGALAMTVWHETTRRFLADAPRLDTLGRRSLAKAIRSAGGSPPDRDIQQGVALAGDVLVNTAYFAAVAVARPALAPAVGLGLGASAGLATLVATPMLGLGPRPGRLKPSTRSMTVAWYAIGGLVAGLAYQRLAGEPAGS